MIRCVPFGGVSRETIAKTSKIVSRENRLSIEVSVLNAFFALLNVRFCGTIYSWDVART